MKTIFNKKRKKEKKVAELLEHMPLFHRLRLHNWKKWKIHNKLVTEYCSKAICVRWVSANLISNITEDDGGEGEKMERKKREGIRGERCWEEEGKKSRESENS